jgi:hypothetical protein
LCCLFFCLFLLVIVLKVDCLINKILMIQHLI